MVEAVLILTLTFSLSAALLLGFLTQRIGLSPIVGYLLAGLIVGPYTPGFVADGEVAEQFAEIGVILLMFGVGLQALSRCRRRPLFSSLRGTISAFAASSSLDSLASMARLHFDGFHPFTEQGPTKIRIALAPRQDCFFEALGQGH